MHRRYAILSVVLSVALAVRAQYDPSFSHYWAMETSFNPAAAGKDTKMNVAGAYNMTLTGFEHNPRTMYIGADLPFYFLGSYHGAGIQLLNDEIGLFSHKRINVQYAFKRRLFGGVLSIGLQGGLLNEKFNGGEVDLDVADDPAFTKSDINGNSFDFGGGIYYSHRRGWYAGVSVQHVLEPVIELGETNELDVSRTYYFTGGYNIRLANPLLMLQTSVMGRTDAVAYRGDVTARLRYVHEKRVMYAGLGYSPTNSVTVFVGGQFHGVMVGYSYEAYTSAINIGNGSHELHVGYQTDIDFGKKGRNKHQSVRLL